MIFYNWERVLSGDVTMTWRVKAAGQHGIRVGGVVIGVFETDRAKYMVGRVIPVQPTGRSEKVGAVRLLSIEERRIKTVTEDEAKACGHESVRAFRTWWGERFEDGRTVHDGWAWGDNPVCWAMRFELVRN